MITQFPTYNNQYYQFNSLKNPIITSFSADKAPLTTKQKVQITTGAILGMTPTLAYLAKRKGFSIHPKKILNTPIKDWAIFKYSPKDKVINFDAGPIIAVATSSVLGGFIGGAIVDKTNIQAKKKEVLNQLLGNVLVPVGCVATGAKLYNKYANKIEGSMPQIKNATKKSSKIINQISQKIPNALGTLTFLSIGIWAGNRVSNFLNEKIYHKKVERGIKASDFAPHIDDVCMATSMMNESSTFGSKLGRIIPLALIVPGYEAGSAR